MSGTGQNDFRAPTSVTTVSGDQRVVNPDGTPTMQFYNFLQRIASLIGQPTGNNPPGQTIASQLSDLQAEVALALFRPVTDAATLQKVQALEAAVASLRGRPQRPPGLSQAQVLARIWFYGT